MADANDEPAHQPEGQFEELNEDHLPAPDTVSLEENKLPGSVPVVRPEPPQPLPEDKHRFHIGTVLVWSVAVITGGGVAIWGLHPEADLRSLLTILTPLTTLTASVTTFYFTREKDR